MEIGKLNQRIAVLENSVKKDAIGNHKARWEEIFSLWASVVVGTNVGSKNINRRDQRNPENRGRDPADTADKADGFHCLPHPL